MLSNSRSFTILSCCICSSLLMALSLSCSQELAKIPLPIWWRVARFLDKKDVGALRCTCRALAHSIVDESDFWKVDDNNTKVEFPKLQILRRTELLKHIRAANPNVQEGAILLVANYEKDAERFVQESSFYYLTGIDVAAVVMLIEFDGSTTLFVPQFGRDPKVWTENAIAKVTANLRELGIDALVQMGKVDSCLCDLFTQQDVYKPLIDKLNDIIKQGGKIFTLFPDEPEINEHQRVFLTRLSTWIDRFNESAVDISEEIGRMRRKKDITELREICKAIDGTQVGIAAAAKAIRHGASELEVQSALDSQLIKRGMLPAFSTMVQSGLQATKLHYMSNSHHIFEGQMVLIDAGWKFHYGSDLSRTFPVSGKFTERQLYLYNAVLETQKYIACIVRPGYWMSNRNVQDKSLCHLALNFFNEKYDGLGKYFIHGVSHYLGLDTHDAGGYTDPLEDGAVITIEPGVYIPEEKIGIRIEDDYLITKNGAICLSSRLPKEPSEIEAMMAQNH